MLRLSEPQTVQCDDPADVSDETRVSYESSAWLLRERLRLRLVR